MDIWSDTRQFVAFHLDGLTSNECRAFEYSVTKDLQDVLTNIDASDQFNDVMWKEHPETVKRILNITLNKICSSWKYFV
uniref:GLOBIN domain-containing protein n=1 Tax=Rhabditophanes sp. KR3021 TaxID=114890 RepID=A0AC35U246_9BILA